MTASDRELDLILFGATGFTGGLTADYLAEHAPRDLRWALAGRNPQRLETVRERLAAIEPACSQLPLFHADLADPGALVELVGRSGAVVSTVGPYVLHGEPLVAACAESGTDYLDLTGEPEFVDRMWLSHHARAVETGARLVHACGFDSIPHDLGVLHAVEQLPEGAPISISGYVRGRGSFSGGTYHSAIGQFARLRPMARAARERRRLERADARPGRSVRGMRQRPHRAPSPVSAWSVPMPTIDPQVVLRSARALERYGPDFAYGHNLVVGSLPRAVALTGAVSGAVALSQLGPTRSLLKKLRDPGEGPSQAQRERAWFEVTFVATGADGRLVTRVSGGDPGYGETAKMLAEAALSIARDELAPSAGQVTTARAIGRPLIDRLEARGIRFEVLEGG